MKIRLRLLCLLFVFSILFLTGCSSSQTDEKPTENAPIAPLNQTKDRSAGAFADLDPWVLKTTDPNAARGNHGIFLGNGVVGATFGGDGGAGKDARCFAAGAYDDKENLLPFHSGHALGLPDPKPGEPYEQTLDMKRGTLTTKIGGVTVSSFVPANYSPFIGVNLKGASPGGKPLSSPNPPLATLEEKENDGSLSRFVNPQVGGRAVGPPSQNLAEHQKQWQRRWADADIQIEGDPEAQQLVRKLMFDLLQSARAGGDDSIAPESLSGDFYKGHIFWDAEIWMFPALLAQHPELARTILDYRFKHLPQAQEQAKKQNCKGADFPWESAASGREVAPGGFSKGRHVTAGVGWATWQYWLATGDKKWMTERGWPLLSNVADYFATRAKKNPATGEYEIKDVFGPDENKGQCDNNAYTNAMAKNVLGYATEAARIVGRPANPQWKIVADKLKLPFDKVKGYYLARDDDKGEKTKQADGELLLWPAKLPMDAKTAAATFDFHKSRPIQNGPAMTDSIHALIAARLGRAAEAEKDFRDSYKPFVRGPFLLFSEKRSLDRCVFTTGAGGILQSVIYGFGGLDFSQPGGIIKTPVAFPPTWKKLTITGIRWKGKRYTLTVTPEGRTFK